MVALTNSDPRLCDCNKIITADAMPPIGGNQPDKQKDISIKADWKYVGVVSYQFSYTLLTVAGDKTSNHTSFIPQSSPGSVFHPPKG
jgi:hypothetical protein